VCWHPSPRLRRAAEGCGGLWRAVEAARAREGAERVGRERREKQGKPLWCPQALPAGPSGEAEGEGAAGGARQRKGEAAAAAAGEGDKKGGAAGAEGKKGK
jgi:hypothetical protein